jgi:tetratricopeptide (TPR) repeat protein
LLTRLPSRLLTGGVLACLAHAQTLDHAQTLERAERAFDAGHYAEAASLFEKAHQESPACESLFGLGMARYRLKQVDAALIALQSAVRCDPNRVVAQLALAEALAENGNYNEALVSYGRVLKLEPGNSSALQGAAAIYLRGKIHNKAVEVLEQLVRAAPSDPQVHADLGSEYVAMGNPEGAELQFQEALRLKPNHPPALLGLANVHLRKGEETQAIALLQKVAALVPDAFEPRFLLGSAYNRLGRYPDALAELKRAQRLGASDSELYYHLARAYAGLGRTEERTQALARFTALTSKAKEDTEARRTVLKLVEDAKALVDSGDLNAALARLEEARELRPPDDQLLFRLASLHYDLHHDAVARSYAEEAISLAPAEWLYHYLLGLIETRSTRWAQAQGSLETALRLNPSSADVRNALEAVKRGQ